MITLYDTVLGREYKIPDNRSLTVGRREGNGIVLRPEGDYEGTQWVQSQGVSRVHCTISNSSRGLFVGDPGSLFGTFVDRKGDGDYVRIGKDSVVPIQDGSIIRVGQDALKYDLVVRDDQRKGLIRRTLGKLLGNAS